MTSSARTTALSPQAVRAARQALGWTFDRLAARANLSSSTIRKFEQGLRDRPRPSTAAAIQAALEAAGVEFREQDGGGLGVRLREGPAA